MNNMRFLLFSFLGGMIFYSGCRPRIIDWAGFATCVLKNTTSHKIGITFHYGSKFDTTFVIEKNSQTKVEEILMEGGAGSYDRPSYVVWQGADSISVLYDDSILIRHYHDTIKRTAKSYNMDSDQSLFKIGSYARTTSPPDADSDKVVNVQLLYTFTEDDYLFAK